MLDTLAIIGAFSLVLYLALLATFNKVHRKLSFYLNGSHHHQQPPLVTGFIPYVGVAPQFSKNPFKYICQLREQYGDVFTIYIMGQFLTFVCHPQDIAKIYSSPKQFDFRILALEQSEQLFGVSRKTLSDQDRNDAAFKMITKTLQNEDLPYLTTRAQQRLEELIKTEGSTEWKNDLLREFATRLIVEASTFAMFGANVGVSSEELIKKFLAFDDSILLLNSNLPDFLKKDAIEARSRFAELFRKVANDDACSLIKGREELYGADCSREEVGRIQMVISWVSLTNTAYATFWALYHLMKLPQHHTQEIIDEIESVLSEHAEEKMPGALLPPLTHEILNKMTRLDALFDEALRVSDLSFVVRRARDTVKFTDRKGRVFKFEDKQMIMMVPSHMDPEIFENPTEFKPDRFLNSKEKQWTKNGETIKLGSAFIPFGGGIHHCPGRFFAKNEMKIIGCLLLLLCEFKLATDKEPIVDEKKAGLFFLNALEDLPFMFRLRSPSVVVGSAEK